MPVNGHPSQEQWLQWIEHPESAESSERLGRHAEECEECRATIGMLRQLLLARGVKRWSDVPPDLIDQAIASSRETPITPSRPFDPTESGPAEIRGSGFGEEPGARFASRVFAEGEIGILAVPPEGDGRWRIRGRIWLHSGEGSSVVHLVQGEHVIASTNADASGAFQIEEIVANGWSLEIHLPNGRALKIEEFDL